MNTSSCRKQEKILRLYSKLTESLLLHKSVFYNSFLSFFYNSIMQACCDLAFQYAHVREAFGTKIGHFQVQRNNQSCVFQF